MWQQWLNLIVGLWIILSSYMNFSTTFATTNYTISGLLIVILAVWGALQYQAQNNRVK